MSDLVRAHASLHPLGNEALAVVGDHAILLGDQESGWQVLPQRPTHGDGNTGGGDRPLNRRQQRLLLNRGVWGEGCSRGAATTLIPSAANGPITFAQLDPSAQAPWTDTTLTTFERIPALL
jgi:hypothetical protein